MNLEMLPQVIAATAPIFGLTREIPYHIVNSVELLSS
jgi:hypothetical protein